MKTALLLVLLTAALPAVSENANLTYSELTGRSVRLDWEPYGTAELTQPVWRLRLFSEALSNEGVRICAVRGVWPPSPHRGEPLRLVRKYCRFGGLDPETDYEVQITDMRIGQVVGTVRFTTPRLKIDEMALASGFPELERTRILGCYRRSHFSSPTDVMAEHVVRGPERTDDFLWGIVTGRPGWCNFDTHRHPGLRHLGGHRFEIDLDTSGNGYRFSGFPTANNGHYALGMLMCVHAPETLCATLAARLNGSGCTVAWHVTGDGRTGDGDNGKEIFASAINSVMQWGDAEGLAYADRAFTCGVSNLVTPPSPPVTGSAESCRSLKEAANDKARNSSNPDDLGAEHCESIRCVGCFVDSLRADLDSRFQ